VDFDAYARTAVQIVNTPLVDMPDLVSFLGADTWAGRHLTEKDLIVFRRTRRRLREVFEHGAADRVTEAATELNALLEAFPVRPRISGHESGTWHLHVTGRGSSVSAEYLAGAVWGLAAWLCEHGSARFGVCADERCGNVYLDTSSNCCRRFCSERCATRSHVAAHRARKRASDPAVALGH
jgi:predicted RNA-binding Zn ribbon-like protein